MNDENPGLTETLNGLEMMAENQTSYRELLCVLEATIEIESWYSNYGKPVYDKWQKIQEKIIPQITTEPMNIDMRTPWNLAEDIQDRHGHMSIHAAEAAAEYWMDQ